MDVLRVSHRTWLSLIALYLRNTGKPNEEILQTTGDGNIISESFEAEESEN